MLCTCQAGFEPLLERELAAAGLTVAARGPGWLLTATETTAPGGPAGEFVFSHLALLAPVELRGASVNALAESVLETFAASLQGERVDAAWPSFWSGAEATIGLSRRAAAIEEEFGQRLRKRFSRIARLAVVGRPLGVGRVRGLFVYFVDFDRAWLARDAWLNGPKRMADDPGAPSRSYLKVEEAYHVLGREPAAGETVVDLGAAPGGWSYSAAKRGARVLAIDNGPLKGAALGHPQIEHRREDAFGYRPTSGQPSDWLFCDLVEEPHHVLRQIVTPWLAQRWCRHFIVNLKFGRVDPLQLLAELRAPDSPLSLHATGVRIRHLYHDREEFTVMGNTLPPAAN